MRRLDLRFGYGRSDDTRLLDSFVFFRARWGAGTDAGGADSGADDGSGGTSAQGGAGKGGGAGALVGWHRLGGCGGPTGGSAGNRGGAGAESGHGGVGAESTGGAGGEGGEGGANSTGGTGGQGGRGGTGGEGGRGGTSGASGMSGAGGASGKSGAGGASGMGGASGKSGAGGASGMGGASGKSGAGGASGLGGAGGKSGAGGASGLGGAGGGANPPIDVELFVESDVDDAVWINGSDERLHYSTSEPYVEVGGDAEMARAGFRFRLPIPAGSTIESAVLRLTRRAGTALPSETMRVQVFDSASVPAFADAHAHGPAAHDPRGLFATVISGFAVGSTNQTVQSPNLAVLVSHVVERADYVQGGTLGIVLSADQLTRWVMFSDRSTETGASLRIRYRRP